MTGSSSTSNRGHWKKFEDTASGPRIAARNAKGQPTNGVDEADEKSFATDWLCDKAVNFIHENKTNPFCYLVSLPDPHGPNTVRAPYDTMYEKLNVPIPVSLTRRPEQIPAWGKSAGVKPEQLRKLMRNYYGMVKCIDDNVGKIIESLRKEKLLDKTLIVFTADHGDLCGEHGRLNKGVPYEGSAKIPFLLYCPGTVKGGTVVDEALSNVDFLPTAMSLLNVSHERKVDGRDASSLFLGESTDWEDIAFVRSTGQPGKPGAAWISAMTKDLKLVYSSIEEPWLLDLKSDPNELTNLFGEAKYQDRIRWMTQKLGVYGIAHKDEYMKIPRIRSWMDQVLKSGG